MKPSFEKPFAPSTAQAAAVWRRRSTHFGARCSYEEAQSFLGDVRLRDDSEFDVEDIVAAITGEAGPVDRMDELAWDAAVEPDSQA